MKPSPWFPINTPPVRSGEYDVRDAYSGSTSRWHHAVLPGGDGCWTLGGCVVSPAPTLQWRGLTDEVWTTRDGTELPIFMIHEEHARNIIRLVIRTAREKRLEAKRAALEFARWEGDN